MGRNRYQFQLYELGGAGAMRGPSIEAAGGVVYVATAGSAAKAAITDKDGTSLTNPRALTRGSCEFYTLTTVESVDLYIACPGGQFVVKKGVTPNDQDIAVDVSQPEYVMVIPFDVAHQTGDATETDSGFDIPTNCAVEASPKLLVETADAGETIDVGILSTETAGDANGFLAAASVATAGLVKGSLASGGQTLGALLNVDESGGGVLVPEQHVHTGSNGQSISWTLTAGSDTAKGFIHLPIVLCAE